MPKDMSAHLKQPHWTKRRHKPVIDVYFPSQEDVAQWAIGLDEAAFYRECDQRGLVPRVIRRDDDHMVFADTTNLWRVNASLVHGKVVEVSIG